MNLPNDRLMEVLSLLKSPGASGRDQRHDPRVSLRASVLVAPCPDDAEPGPAFAVRVQDLSAGGIAVQHFSPMPKGRTFVIDLPVETGDKPGVRVLCRVQYCRPAAEHQHLIGAEFLRLWTAPAPTLDFERTAA